MDERDVRRVLSYPVSMIGLTACPMIPCRIHVYGAPSLGAGPLLP